MHCINHCLKWIDWKTILYYRNTSILHKQIFNTRQWIQNQNNVHILQKTLERDETKRKSINLLSKPLKV